jgi:hypothetical protein
MPNYKFGKIHKYLKINTMQIHTWVLLRNGQANGQIFGVFPFFKRVTRQPVALRLNAQIQPAVPVADTQQLP